MNDQSPQSDSQATSAPAPSQTGNDQPATNSAPPSQTPGHPSFRRYIVTANALSAVSSLLTPCPGSAHLEHVVSSPPRRTPCTLLVLSVVGYTEKLELVYVGINAPASRVERVRNVPADLVTFNVFFGLGPRSSVQQWYFVIIYCGSRVHAEPMSPTSTWGELRETLQSRVMCVMGNISLTL